MMEERQISVEQLEKVTGGIGDPESELLRAEFSRKMHEMGATRYPEIMITMSLEDEWYKIWKSQNYTPSMEEFLDVYFEAKMVSV